MPIQKVYKKYAFARALMMSGIVVMTALSVEQAKADVTDQLLDQLKAKGILTKGEYAKLKERHAAEKTAPVGPAGRRLVTKEGVVIVPDDRYVTRLDKGIGLHIGQVDVKVSGILAFFGDEAFKTQYSGSAAAINPATGVAGGVVGNVVGSNSRTNNSNAIRSGLLPSEIAVSLSTNQEGYDLSATFGAYIGGNNVNPGTVLNANNGGSPVALGTSGIDFRQVFGTIGTPQFGTVKVGRDLGLFGADAILNDATLFGSGSLLANGGPANTSLGRIGVGYIYADWMPQVTYTTPDYNGFTASVGVFTPYDAANTFTGLDSANLTGHDQPQLQAQVHYKGQITPEAKLLLWADAITQQHRAEAGDVTTMTPGSSVRSWGIDGGGKVDVGPVSLLAYGYYGEGLGTTGIFTDAFSLNGQERKSYGGYAQGSYNITDKLMIGASWGISYLEANSFDVLQAYNPFLLRSNESYIGFARYKLTNWMNIQAEYIHNIAKNQTGGRIESDELAVGTVWFF